MDVSVAKWVVGIATAAAVSLSGWTLKETSQNQSRISVVEERSEGVRRQLDRIEDSIDWLVQERVKDYARPSSSSRQPRERSNRESAP